MDQQPVEEGHASDESEDKTNQKTIEWSHVFDWGFWTNHPLAVLTLFIGGLLLAPITSFPGGNPKSLWFVAFGIWIILGTVILWVFSGIIARMEGREFFTKQETEERENAFKTGIQSRLEALEQGISDTKKQLAAQEPRYLTAAQKQAIKDAIKPYAGQNVDILSLMFDNEGSRYGEDFASVFAQAGWEVRRLVDSRYPTDFFNLQVLPSGDTTLESMNQAAIALRQILMKLGLVKGGEPQYRHDGIKEAVQLRIGIKPISALNETQHADQSERRE